MKEYLKKLLDQRAAADELFAARYALESKSIEDCCKYIIGEVYEQSKNNKRENNCVSAGYADEDIMNIAVHYYTEDKVEIKTIGGGVKTKTATSTTTKTTLVSKTKPADNNIKVDWADKSAMKKRIAERKKQEASIELSFF